MKTSFLVITIAVLCLSNSISAIHQLTQIELRGKISGTIYIIKNNICKLVEPSVEYHIPLLTIHGSYYNPQDYTESITLEASTSGCFRELMVIQVERGGLIYGPSSKVAIIRLETDNLGQKNKLIINPDGSAKIEKIR